MTSEPGPAGHPSRRAGAFYGRRKARPLGVAVGSAAERLLPALRLDLADAKTPVAMFPDPVDAIRLEIGFGGGEHLVREAARFPQTGFIGAEPFVNGVASACALIEAAGVRNVRLHDDDAVPLLEALPAASLARIDLLYADPWPKRRHWKRRFVGTANVQRMARVIRPGGELRIASDIPDLVAWTLMHLQAIPAFRWTAARKADWDEPWEGWERTRFEARAKRDGRRPAYLIFRRDDA